MRTYHVAIVAESEQDVHKFLLASPLDPSNDKSQDPPIEEWWIAEDDRQDGSTGNESAVFVPRSMTQDEASQRLRGLG